MTLLERHFGRARLQAEARTIGISTEGEEWTSHCFLANRSALPVLTWEEIDQSLARYGYARQGPPPSAIPRDGVEFDVVGWRRDFGLSHGVWERDEDLVVAVPLPLNRVGDFRRALDELGDGWRWHEDEITALKVQLDEMNPTIVLLSAEAADALRFALDRTARRRERSDEGRDQVLEDLHASLNRAYPVSGPWPLVRDALHTALREALSGPGAQGLAARDELLDLISRFAETHRTATASDDADQLRLQAERTAPEPPDPATGPVGRVFGWARRSPQPPPD
ncbi:hypothetical protein ACWEFL_28555 [Streptomyces sp. NPDC004838]